MTELTDPTTADAAAERVPLTAAQEARAYLSTPVTPKWFGRELVSKLLDEHDEMAAELEQVRGELAKAQRLFSFAKSLSDRRKWQCDQARVEVYNLAAERQQLCDATLEAAGLLHRLSGPGPCDYDGDGACRGHDGFASGYLASCPHPAGRRFVETWGAAQGHGDGNEAVSR